MSLALETPAQWERRCLSKNGYRTEMRARVAAFAQFHKPKPPAGPLYVYPCDICGEWHLTKRANERSPITADSPFDLSRMGAKENPAVRSGGARAQSRANQRTHMLATLRTKNSQVPPPQQKLSPTQQLERWFDQGRSEVFSVHTTLTPQMAQMLLDRNPDNRAIQERAANRSVGAYAAMMLRGEWRLNGEPIIVSREGLLNDGQHRASACVLSNTSIPVSITFGVERETRSTVDQGKARSNGDVLSLAGETDVNRLAAAIRFVWAVTRKLPLSDCPSPEQLLTEIQRHPGLREAVRKTGALVKPLKASATISGAYYLCHEHAPAQADDFLERVTTGLNITHKNHPEAQLRRRLEEHARGTKLGKLHGHEQAAIFIKAFNLYLHRRNTRALAWKPSIEGFPVVGE